MIADEDQVHGLTVRCRNAGDTIKSKPEPRCRKTNHYGQQVVASRSTRRSLSTSRYRTPTRLKVILRAESPLGAEGDPSGVCLASAGFTISDTAKPHRAATDPMSQPEFSYQEISGRDLDRPE